MALLLPTIDALTFVGAFDHGKPNEERIVLAAATTTNLAEYVVCLGVSVPGGLTVPIPNYMFWFSEEVVEPPTRVFLYTGLGTKRITTVQGSGHPALVLHWGLKETVLQDPSISPVVFRLGGILTPASRSLLEVLLGQQGTSTPPPLPPFQPAKLLDFFAKPPKGK